MGIHTDKRSQFVFVDTPGYQTRHTNALNRVMNRTVGQVAGEVDAIMFVIDAAGWDARDEPVLALLPKDTPVVLALNKVDRLRDRAALGITLAECAKRHPFAALVPVSATK